MATKADQTETPIDPAAKKPPMDESIPAWPFVAPFLVFMITGFFDFLAPEIETPPVESNEVEQSSDKTKTSKEDSKPNEAGQVDEKPKRVNRRLLRRYRRSSQAILDRLPDSNRDRVYCAGCWLENYLQAVSLQNILLVLDLWNRRYCVVGCYFQFGHRTLGPERGWNGKLVAGAIAI